MRGMRWRYWALVATFVAVLAALVVVIHGNRVTAAKGKQAHDALCVFKADLARRAVAGRAFLNEHPEGIAGIPAATLRTSIANQQSTLDALSDLDCPTPAGS